MPRRTPPPATNGAPADGHTYLRAGEVARRLNVHQHQVYELVKRKDLVGVKFGRILRITEQSVNEYIAAAHAAAGH
jgi:excisionase family DNA binding protein